MPLVIRLTGTNEAEAIAILTRSGFSAVTDMDDAVQRAVALAQGGRMSVFIDRTTRLLVQGITGPGRIVPYAPDDRVRHDGRRGVTPGKGGQRFDGAVPVFDTVAEAVRETQPNTTVIYVPPVAAAAAIFEAADAGVRADRLHHRRRSGAGHDRGDAVRDASGACG